MEKLVLFVTHVITKSTCIPATNNTLQENHKIKTNFKDKK